MRTAAQVTVHKGLKVVTVASALSAGFSPLTNAYYPGEEAMLNSVIEDMGRAGIEFALVVSDGGLAVYRKGMVEGAKDREPGARADGRATQV